MARPDDRETVGAWFNLFQAGTIVSGAIDERLRTACGLSVTEHELLLRLSHAPEGKVRMVDLASLLLTSKSGITRLVDRLEREGYVARELCARDRRVTYARLTERGYLALRRSGPVFQAALDEHFARHLAPHQLSALRAALRRLLEGHGAWDDARCCPPAGHPPAPPHAAGRPA